MQIPDYIQIVEIICGMVTIGYLGDRIGRKWGSVTTVSLMCVGAVLLTVQNGTTDKGQTIFCEYHTPPARTIDVLLNAMQCATLPLSVPVHLLHLPCLLLASPLLTHASGGCRHHRAVRLWVRTCLSNTVPVPAFAVNATAYCSCAALDAIIVL